MADAIDTARAEGYSDEEISNWLAAKRAEAKAAGYDDHEIDNYVAGFNMPRDIPEPFLDRFSKTMPFTGFVAKTATDVFNASGGAVVSPKMEADLQKIGLWNDPARGQTSPLRFAYEAVMRPVIANVNGAMSLINAGIAGAAAVAAASVTDKEDQSGRMRALRDFNMLGQTAAVLSGAAPYGGPISKPHLGPMGEVSDINVGDLPSHQTVIDSAKALGGPDVPAITKEKAVTLYETKGVHPAEIVDDASRDVTVKQNMLSINKDLPYQGEILEPWEPNAEIKSLSAETGIPTDTLTKEEFFDAYATKLAKEGTPGQIPLLTPENEAAFVAAQKRLGISMEDILGEKPQFTTEPDHENPNQFVAKNEAGEVVATADTAEAALQKATAGELVAPGTELTTGEGGTPPPPPPPGEPGALPPPEGPQGPRGPTIEHETMSYDDAKADVLSKLSVGESEGKRPWTFSRLYTNLIDKLFPLSRETLRASNKLGEPLSTANNPEHLARLLSGTAGKADHMLKYGTFDFLSYKNNGPGLEAILAPIRDKLDDFRAYIVSRQALSLEEKGISTGINTRAAERVVDEKFAEFAGIHGQLVDYQNRVAAYLRDSGVISKEGYAEMVAAHENYVPFYRIFNEEEGAVPRPATALSEITRKIGSSEAKIIDPLESIIKNTYLYTHMAERNHVGVTLVDLLDRAGESPVVASPMWADADRAKVDQYMRDLGVKNPDSLMAFVQTASETPTGENFTVLRDGVRETRRVDPELAQAMKSLNRETLDPLIKMLQIPASLLRGGAVLTPEFMFRHILRDYQYAFITAKGVFTPVDMMRGMWSLISKDEAYQQWLKSGGANISVAALDRNYMQESIANLTKSTGLGVRAQNVVDLLSPQMDFSTADIRKQLLHPLQVGLELAQSASHLGAFKKAMRASEAELLPGEEPTKGMLLQAGQESRATGIDPSRIGASMQSWNAITAFGNIALQDSDRIVRAFKDKPLSTTLKITGAMTLPSVLLWAYNHDDPDWAEIPQWQKDLFWIVPAWKQDSGGEVYKVFFRLPKPWATGLLFASGPERLLQTFLTDNPPSAESFLHSLKETTIPNLAPTAASPILDDWTNSHLFSGRTLIPQNVEKLLPEYQYTQYSTELSKRLGASIAPFAGKYSSPILLENYLRGWTGGLGQYVLNLTDEALRQQGVLPDPPNPTSTLADIPIVRAFAIRYPSATVQSVEDFHQSYAENKKYYDTYMAKAKEGDEAAMKIIMDRGGPQMFVQLDGIQQAIATQNKVIRDIWKNPDIKPEKKRQFIDQLYYEIIDVARQGNNIIKSLPK